VACRYDAQVEVNRVFSQNHPLWVTGNFYSGAGADRDRYRHSLRPFGYPAYRQHALWSFPGDLPTATGASRWLLLVELFAGCLPFGVLLA
jgi:hypothetical protein